MDVFLLLGVVAEVLRLLSVSSSKVAIIGDDRFQIDPIFPKRKTLDDSFSFVEGDE